MKTISLINSNLLIFIDDKNWLEFTLYTWYLCNGYARRLNDNIYLHKILASRLKINNLDHKDRNKLNNQINNFREATKSQNEQNKDKRKGCSSQYKGVSWNNQYEKWDTYIKIKDKIIRLGYFNDEIEAAKAYNTAATKYFGEYACLNKV